MLTFLTDRFFSQLTIIIVLASVWCLGYVLDKTLVKKYREWIMARKLWGYLLMPWYPVVCVPVAEELLFRMPLLILFDRLTPVAWVVIIASNIVFAWFHKYPSLEKYAVEYSRDFDLSEVGAKRLRITLVTWSKLVSGLVGVGCAYLAITRQSIVAALLLRSVANLFVCSFLFAIGILLIAVVVLLGMALLSKIIPRSFRRRFSVMKQPLSLQSLMLKKAKARVQH